MKSLTHAGFLVTRGVGLIAFLAWTLAGFSTQASHAVVRSPELLFMFVVLVLFWFCFSVLLDLLWPAGSSASLRNSVYAMIDVFIVVRFLFNPEYGNVIPVSALVAVYCFAGTFFCGFPVGLVAAMAGMIGVFNAQGLDPASMLEPRRFFLPLVCALVSGLAATGLAFLLGWAVDLLLARKAGRDVADAAVSAAGGVPVLESREELTEKLRVMRENFDKVCKERDELLEQIAAMEDKAQNGSAS